ncbi:prominin-1-A-like isoform X1 [Mytilus edulis]|uniref:prominin-1-A-like isoform X1 n=1 Tax=Mytilus edulis TaxID=6550 RepID=UPI0039F0C49C
MQIFNFVIVFCWICTIKTVGSGTITDTYGNVAYGNGTISWADPPSGMSYKTVNGYDPGTLSMLYDVVRGFVNTVQSQPFPFNIINDVLNGDFDISTRYMELIDVVTGFAVCFVIGLLFVIFFPLCGCCFCCCRCCGNCGGDLKYEEDPNEDCKRMGFAQALFIMSLLLATSAACVYITNDNFTVAIKYADTSIADNLDDVNTYINNTIMQFQYVAVGMYTIVSDSITADITGIGKVMSDAVQANLNITPVITAVTDLDTSLQAIKTALDQSVTDITALQSAANTLTTDLNALSSDIGTTKSSCSSDCTPTTACDGFDETALVVSADFSTLPDLTSVQSSIDGVVAQNLTGIAQTAQSQLDNMETTIDSSTSSARSSIQSSLDSFKSTLNTMVDDFVTQVNGAIDTYSLKTEIGKFFQSAIDYDVYRQYFGYGLMGLFSFIPLLMIGGIMCGCCCGDAEAKPSERPCCSSCGGCLMMLAVAIMFLIGALLMLLTTVTFMIGGNLEKICQSFIDLTVFSDFIDQGAIPSFHLGTMILGDPTVNISVYSLILGCRMNKAPFTILSLDKIIPIDNYLNYSTYLTSIDSDINGISSSVDISSFQVLTPDMESSLNDFSNSGIDGIDFAAINTSLAQHLVTFDINTLISSMTSIKNQCTGTSDSRWATHISDAETIRDVTIPAVTTAQSNLQTSISSLESAISGIMAKINNTLSTARAADNEIQNNMASVILQAAIDFKNQILAYIDSYIVEVRDLIFNELAACLPIWNLYDSFTTTFCSYTLDALNTFWFAIGWGLFFFTPVIIVGVKLSKYYRKLSEDEDDDGDDDEDDGYNGYHNGSRQHRLRSPRRFNKVSPQYY